MAAVEERSDEVPAPPARRGTRPLVAALLVVAIVAAGLAAYRRHDDQATKWESREVPWRSVALSADGETLTFTMSMLGTCESLDRVEWEGDPAVADEVIATVHVRMVVRQHGHQVFCIAAGAVNVTFAVAAPAGIRPDVVIVDGADPGRCPGPVRQRLDEPAPTTPYC